MNRTEWLGNGIENRVDREMTIETEWIGHGKKQRDREG